jgi:hypothetical protein
MIKDANELERLYKDSFFVRHPDLEKRIRAFLNSKRKKGLCCSFCGNDKLTLSKDLIHIVCDAPCAFPYTDDNIDSSLSIAMFCDNCNHVDYVVATKEWQDYCNAKTDAEAKTEVSNEELLEEIKELRQELNAFNQVWKQLEEDKND